MIWVQMQTVEEAHFFMFGLDRFYKIKADSEGRGSFVKASTANTFLGEREKAALLRQLGVSLTLMKNILKIEEFMFSFVDISASEFWVLVIMSSWV